MSDEMAFGANARYEDAGKLVLRLTLGGLMLFHGFAKLTGGIDFIFAVVAKAGLPSFVAYGVYVGEVLAPALLIAGWYSRAAATIIAVNIMFALGLVHTPELFKLGDSGGWALELQGMFLFTAVALALLGPGQFSIDRRRAPTSFRAAMYQAGE
ncbi:MAG TPA: DoxX family protein [Steroidobacter sp.]|nr:DoxX family protein [Steroidobacter sp.]